MPPSWAWQAAPPRRNFAAVATPGESRTPTRKVAAIVALRRLAAPEVATFLDDPDETVLLEAARAIYDDASIPDALPELAEVLARTDLKNPALLRRAIGAAFRNGRTRDLELLSDFIQSRHPDPALRRTALASILWWARPPALDPVEGRYRKLDPRDPEPMHAIVARLRDTIATDPDLTEVLLNGAIELGHAQWLTGLNIDPQTAPADLQVRYLRAAGKAKLADREKFVRAALDSSHQSVREEAREQAEKRRDSGSRDSPLRPRRTPRIRPVPGRPQAGHTRRPSAPENGSPGSARITAGTPCHSPCVSMSGKPPRGSESNSPPPPTVSS